MTLFHRRPANRAPAAFAVLVATSVAATVGVAPTHAAPAPRGDAAPQGAQAAPNESRRGGDADARSSSERPPSGAGVQRAKASRESPTPNEPLARGHRADAPVPTDEGTWITIGATVTEVDDAAFRIDHGNGSISVGMDDWEAYGDGWIVNDGDRVRVYGRVDDELLEDASMEAERVFVQDVGTLFFADPADEGAVGELWDVRPVDVGEVVVIGRVAGVDADDGTLRLAEGSPELVVDVSPMIHDPLDDAGYQQIEAGDRVSVTGEFDDALFTDGYVYATSIVTLSR